MSTSRPIRTMWLTQMEKMASRLGLDLKTVFTTHFKDIQQKKEVDIYSFTFLISILWFFSQISNLINNSDPYWPWDSHLQTRLVTLASTRNKVLSSAPLMSVSFPFSWNNQKNPINVNSNSQLYRRKGPAYSTVPQMRIFPSDYWLTKCKFSNKPIQSKIWW